MKYSPQHYAQAAIALMREGASEERVLHLLARVIMRHNDMLHIQKIGAAIERALVAERGGNWVTLEFAHRPHESIVSRLQALFQDNNRVETEINSELLAGVRVTINGEREIDISFQKKIQSLFK